MTNEQRAVFRVPASQPTPHPTRPSRAFILAPMTQPPQKTAHARSSQHQSTLCWGTICQRAAPPALPASPGAHTLENWLGGSAESLRTQRRRPGPPACLRLRAR
jgi:hypothetical protein